MSVYSEALVEEGVSLAPTIYDLSPYISVH